jgi:hypothetical protein
VSLTCLKPLRSQKTTFAPLPTIDWRCSRSAARFGSPVSWSVIARLRSSST